VSSHPAAAAPVLRLRGISKSFGALRANDDISLDLHAGEVLALLGENGAGKSTLMSILFGHYVADAGEVQVFGQRLPPGQPRAALAAGVGMVHQHFTLADNLSVLDNVVLGSEPLWQPFTRRAAARRKLQDTAQRFGLTVDADARVGSLSVGERQRVEILKALYRGARILILDEPTAVLTPQEAASLFEVLGQMLGQGLAIVFISHKLDEVMRVSQRVAVLRGGRLVALRPTAEVDAAALAQAMVGHEVAAPRRQPARVPPSPQAVCELLDVGLAGADRQAAHNIHLRLHGGEIVAIAGVSGNGQAAVAALLCGQRQASSGQVFWLGKPWPKGTQALAMLVGQGLARVPEDRQGTGLVGDLPLWENAVAERMDSAKFSRRLPPALGPRWVRAAAARQYAQTLMAAMDVRGGGIHSAAKALSGGNMQKLILGRALLTPDGQPPRLIVAHQPTWGLDVGAVQAVQQRLLAARDAGAAVLLISDDLDEVLNMGDRIAVMHAGRLTPAVPAAQWSREQIGLAMAGAGATAGAAAAPPLH
jgi:general nucleoside transport system ATP-binding protein